MGDISFAGNGSKDVDMSNTNTQPSEPKGSEGPIKMAGDGMKDTTKSFGTSTPDQSIPGGGISFAGDGSKDA